jgi:ketosteroid isomerase-like protein
MSDENVEKENVRVVLEGLARFNADEGGLEQRLQTLPEVMAMYWWPDAEYHTDSRDPDSAIHRGLDAITRHFANWIEAYPDLKVEPLEEAKASGDKVFLWLRYSGHGAESTLPIEMELAQVITMRDGKWARTVEYADKAEALEAAGLPGGAGG